VAKIAGHHDKSMFVFAFPDVDGPASWMPRFDDLRYDSDLPSVIPESGVDVELHLVARVDLGLTHHHSRPCRTSTIISPELAPMAANWSEGEACQLCHPEAMVHAFVVDRFPSSEAPKTRIATILASRLILGMGSPTIPTAPATENGAVTENAFRFPGFRELVPGQATNPTHMIV
jgi:hypothetical protein